MTDTTPMTPEREQEIRNSIPTVYGPPWTVHPDMDVNVWRVLYATDHPLAGLVAEVPDYGAHLAEFIATARAAVPELLAEIERLRGQRRYLLDQIAKKDARSGEGDAALKEFLGGKSASTAEPPAEPLVVSRYDVAIEPAPEEEPVLTVGAVAEDGRPVALLFDPETRAKVAGWLASSDAGEKSSREADATPQPLMDLPAAIASCPGYETSPNICRCPCGCKHHCGAHDTDEPAEDERPVSVGQTYWRATEPDVRVKVTGVWQNDGEDEPGIAFDIHGKDHRGRPCTTHSALRLSLFRELYRLDTTVKQPETGGEGGLS